MGIGEIEDAAKLPMEKYGKIDDVFPWGTQWPPPKDAGNFAGEELMPALAAGKFSDITKVMDGYSDAFVNTSPVGSFAANRFGLYDMSGNVWQWCADWFEKDQKHRVARGSSWSYTGRGGMLSSNRPHYTPDARVNRYGFRCVLASASIPLFTSSLPDEWEPPVNLGPMINTANSEAFATLSADELVLVFGSSGRLWECSRPSVEAAFSMARNIPALESDTAEQKSDPCLSPDGLTLYYSAKPPPEGGDNGWRLYQTRRNSRAAAWEAPKRLGPSASDYSGFVQHPVITADGLTLLFDNGGGTDSSILCCRRTSLDAPFGKPDLLWRGTEVVRPCWLSPDQTTLLFAEAALAPPYTTRRLNVAKLIAGQVSDVRPLLLPIEDSANWGWLSPDGMTLYFSSTMPGGRGGHDLWQIRRKASASPLVKPANSGVAATTSPDRAAALRVLEKGGKVTIRSGSKAPQTITSAATLPAGEFALETVQVQTSPPSEFNDADMALLTGLPKLRSVELSYTKVTGAGLAVLKMLPALDFVSLNGIKPLRDEDLLPLKECRSLVRLLLSNVGEKLSSAGLEPILALDQLRDLALGRMTLGDDDLKKIAGLRKLQKLNVSGNTVSAAALEQLKALPDLEWLTLDLNKLDRPVDFASFPRLTKITTPGLTSEGLKNLAFATRLESLDASLQPLSAGLLTQLAEVCQGLKELNLNVDRALPPGTSFTALPKLESLVITVFRGDSLFDDAALLDLAKQSQLKKVVIVSAPRLTSQGLAAFKKLRPDVKIDGYPLPAPQKVGDGTANAAALPNTLFPPGHWVKRYTQAADIHQQWYDWGTLWQDGWIKGRSNGGDSIVLAAANARGQNWGARARYRWDSGGKAEACLRWDGVAATNTVTQYLFRVEPGRAYFLRTKGKGEQNGSDTFPLNTPVSISLTLGQEFTLEAFVIGDTLYGRVDGKLITAKTEGILTEGTFQLAASVCPYRDLEFINLDGLSEAEALKAAGIDQH